MTGREIFSTIIHWIVSRGVIWKMTWREQHNHHRSSRGSSRFFSKTTSEGAEERLGSSMKPVISHCYRLQVELSNTCTVRTRLQRQDTATRGRKCLLHCPANQDKAASLSIREYFYLYFMYISLYTYRKRLHIEDEEMEGHREADGP